MKQRFLFLLCAALAACGTESAGPDSGTPTVDAADETLGCIPLTEATVEPFVRYGTAVTRADLECPRAQIERARGDEAVVAALFAWLWRDWTIAPDGGVNGDYARCKVILEIVKDLGPSERAKELNDFIWQSYEVSGVSELVGNAASALACFRTDEAKGYVQKIITDHPDPAVRNAAKRQIQEQYCGFFAPL